ncbi:MAG: hypothetical protein IPM38_08145 [Ignavibacteria bacterium]|nr:hypothetical protein [Ignavibacteria bacterium]
MSGLLSESNIVIGYNSIALFEARAQNIKTFSLNLFPVKDSLRNAFETAGIITVEATRSEIMQAIILDSDILSREKIFSGGISSCIKVISGKLNLTLH